MNKETEQYIEHEVRLRLDESRLAEHKTEVYKKFDKIGDRIDSMESKLNARIDSIETKLDAKMDAVESRLDAKMDTKFAAFESKFEGRFLMLGGLTVTSIIMPIVFYCLKLL